MELQCLHCNKPLQAGHYEGNRVNRCVQCGGVFLYQKSLSRIKQNRDVVIPRNAPIAAPKSEVKRRCPKCQIVMEKVKTGRLKIVTVDLCTRCAGLWLDKNELELIQLDYELLQENQARNRQQSQQAKQFHCPKCGHPQARSAECVKCGIIFEKYQKVQAQFEADREKQQRKKSATDDIYVQLQGYEFKQKPRYVEAIVGYETHNEYTLHMLGTTPRCTWYAQETRGILESVSRNIFGFLYPYTLQVYDHNRDVVLTLKERIRFFFFRTEAYEADGTLIGYAQRRFSFIRRVITVHNPRGVELYQVKSKILNPFFFMITKHGVQRGTLIRKWNKIIKELFSDADNFTINFPRNDDPKSKKLYLCTAYMVDKAFFDAGNMTTSGQILRMPFLDTWFFRIIMLLLALAILI